MVLPPRNLGDVVGNIEIKILSIGAVESLDSILVDHFSRLFGFVVEPVGYLCSGGLDEGLDEG